MIDEKKLAELRRLNYMPNTAWELNELQDLIEALWKVARAAELVSVYALAESNQTIAPRIDYFVNGERMIALKKVLTALHDSAKEKDGPKKTNNLTYEDTV